MRLHRGEYIFTEEGDTLGFTNEDDGCSIAYNVDPGLDQSVWPSIVNLVEDVLPQIGDNYVFISNALPYDFAVGAAYDTGTLQWGSW